MTEKRFTLHKGLDTINIMDNTKFREQIYINKSSKDMKCLVGLLNELHEDLKHELTVSKALRDVVKELEKENEQLKHDATVLICSNQDYRKENEQLKQVIKEVLKLLEEEVDLFSDKATEHDIQAYIELGELDNKDAYYMAISTKKAIKLLKEVIE